MSKDKITSTVNKLPQSRIEIVASIPSEIFDATREKAIASLGQHVELPGFRKGHVPEKVLLSKLSEQTILSEMAEITISRAYPMLVTEHKLDVIGRPEIKITKLAMGNALEFTASSDVFPEIKLPDYQAIAKKVNQKKEEVIVSDEDIEKTITEIRKIKAKHLAEETGKSVEEIALPELTDEYVKGLGNFENVEDFKIKIKENITQEKSREQQEKHRIEVIEAIIKETKTELPQIIIEQELTRMEEEFANDIRRMGMEFGDYMKQLGKTREDMRKDWGSEAEKRALVQLIVSEIARKEMIAPDDESVERDVQKIHIMYPQAPIERIKSYVDMVLTNELVFQFLDGKEVPKMSHTHEDGTVHRGQTHE